MTTVALRRVARVLNGGTPTPDEANWNGEVPWATPVDLARVDGMSIRTTERTLTALGVRTGSTMAPAGSVLVSSRAPIGYTALNVVPMAFNQGCKAVVPSADRSSRFLQYALIALTETMKASGSGSTFLEMSADALASRKVPEMTRDEQRRIADFLDDRVARIDQIITARREQLVLNTEHFRSEAEERLRQFPAVPVRYLAREILVGIVIQPAKLYTDKADGVPALRGLNVREGEIIQEDLVRITPDGHRLNPRSKLRTGEVVVVRTGDAGSAAVVPAACDDWNCIDLVVVRPADGVSAQYLEIALNSAKHQASVSAASSGAMQQHFGVNALGALPIPYPGDADATVGEELAALRTAMARRSGELQRSIDLLAEYKQSLITAAVTGELDVTTAGSGIPG